MIRQWCVRQAVGLLPATASSAHLATSLVGIGHSFLAIKLLRFEALLYLHPEPKLRARKGSQGNHSVAEFVINDRDNFSFVSGIVK